MHGFAMHKKTFAVALENTIYAQLRSHLNADVTAKFGRILLHGTTELYVIVIAFAMPRGIINPFICANMDPARYTNVDLRMLQKSKHKIFAPFGKMLSRKENHNMAPNLFRAFYPYFLRHRSQHIICPCLLSFLNGLLDSNTSCDHYAHVHVTRVTSSKCTLCHIRSALPPTFNTHLVHCKSTLLNDSLLQQLNNPITPTPIFQGRSHHGPPSVHVRILACPDVVLQMYRRTMSGPLLQHVVTKPLNVTG